MAVTWVTADHHFGHGGKDGKHGVIEYCSRPFADVWKMDEALVDAWNSVVSKGDTVYHLGDLTLGKDADILWRLRGDIHILAYPWHHDAKWLKVAAKYPITLEPPIIVLKHEPPITLSHFPMVSWLASHHGSWHLFGHTHDRYRPDSLSMDVGVDAAYRLFGEYRPFAMEEVEEIMKGRT